VRESIFPKVGITPNFAPLFTYCSHPSPFPLPTQLKSSQGPQTLKRHSLQVIALRYQQLVQFQGDGVGVTCDPFPAYEVGDAIRAMWMCEDKWIGEMYRGIIVDITKPGLDRSTPRYGVLFEDTDNVVFTDDPAGVSKIFKEDGEECTVVGPGIEPFFIMSEPEVVLSWKFSSSNKSGEGKMKGVSKSSVSLGGWTTELTGKHVFRSLQRAMHTYDTMLVDTSSDVGVSKRQLNIEDAWDFPRGSTKNNPPDRLSGFEHVSADFVKGASGGKSATHPVVAAAASGEGAEEGEGGGGAGGGGCGGGRRGGGGWGGGGGGGGGGAGRRQDCRRRPPPS